MAGCLRMVVFEMKGLSEVEQCETDMRTVYKAKSMLVTRWCLAGACTLPKCQTGHE